MHEQLGLGFGEGDLLPFKKSSRRKIQRAKFSKDRRAFDHYNLTQVIEGKSNRDAIMSLDRFLYSNDFPYPAFYLHGKSGVGKSLMAMATIGEFLQSSPQTICKLFSGSDFIAEREAAIEVNRKSSFLQESSDADLLVIDGLHQLLLSRDIIQDFIHIISQAELRGTKVIVISSLSLPSIKRHSTDLEKALITFFPAKIDNMDTELSEKLFRSKVSELNISLGSDVWSSLSFRTINNGYDVDRLIREIFRIKLLEAVDSLDTESLIKHGLLKESNHIDLELDSFVAELKKGVGIDPSEILSISRKANIALDRHLSMHYLNKGKGISLSRIARYFNRDHTVVIYAVKKIESELRSPSSDKFFERLIAYQRFISPE
ncbi:MAG: ATP-binding protein [Bacteriovoracaceae bacterium]|nr:ATP-binding protein [Bacteriovoracaceae bacterium]